jgi:ketosteroid isomerase-like protein
MALTNLDLVRSICVPWERGDFFSSASWADPEIELVLADGPEPGSWKGLAGMAAGARSRLSAWEDYRFVVDEYRELDDERVLAIFHRGGRGKTSGLEIGEMHTQGAHLFHVCGGKVTRWVAYFDRDRALTDLGLAPDAGSP